jgi:hypothetical protein
MQRQCLCGQPLIENDRKCVCGNCSKIQGNAEGARCVPKDELICRRCGPVSEFKVLRRASRSLLCDSDLGLVGIEGAAPGVNLGIREGQFLVVHRDDTSARCRCEACRQARAHSRRRIA